MQQSASNPPRSQESSQCHRVPKSSKPCSGKQRARKTMLGLFERGVFLNPMGTKLYLSIAHDEAICDAFCERLADTLNER
ncbi:hypothetical protein FAZ69_13890 [Trinickia terrae]|uniref:Uncharacterized protein n=1 Tax=Trinickia terrae TaxID=2571161 RepID=A0A4U1I6C9_9BURK|nr:hypothetical protein [Trinickia terrae]TKC88827.1 hypothetical protein FAZ69_13890 [Trinickia terrae]